MRESVVNLKIKIKWLEDQLERQKKWGMRRRDDAHIFHKLLLESGFTREEITKRTNYAK